jgi:hypothetical protein
VVAIYNTHLDCIHKPAYSLLSAGFHGNNGLDPSTSMHILKTYIIPTLMYSLIFSVDSLGSRNMLYMNVNALICSCPSIGISPDKIYYREQYQVCFMAKTISVLSFF